MFIFMLWNWYGYVVLLITKDEVDFFKTIHPRLTGYKYWVLYVDYHMDLIVMDV